MKICVGICLFFLPATAQFGLGQTVQTLGLPNPVVGEFVFPHIAFGKSEGVELKTSFVVVNSLNNEAYVEFELFDPDGRHAFPDWDSRNCRRRPLWRASVPPGRVVTVVYPRTGCEPVKPRMFVGWGMLRANQEVTVFQRISVTDTLTGETVSEVTFTGQSPSIKTTQVPVWMRASQNTGISLVNPDRFDDLEITFQLWARNDILAPLAEAQLAGERTITIAPHSQAVLVVRSLFSGVSGNLARIIPEEEGSTFGMTVIGWRSEPDQPSRTHLWLPGRHDITGEELTRIDPGDPWDFPVRITRKSRLRRRDILLTAFGFVLQPNDGTEVQLHKMPLGGVKIVQPGLSLDASGQLVVNQDLGLAIVGSDARKAIIFADSKKVIQMPMVGAIDYIISVNGARAEIKTSWLGSTGLSVSFWSRYLLIDVLEEAVVDSFTTVGLSEVPPWRE